MVLQQGQKLPVWGTAAPGEAVSVSFGKVTVQTTAGPTGDWQVVLPAEQACAEPRVLVVRGSNDLRFEDVLVGEVWLCSGQSNMEKPLGRQRGQQPTDDWEEEVRNANHPLIRLFQVPRNGHRQQDDGNLQWHPCASEVVERVGFSAAAYFFGREIQSALGVPVGLVHASVGGTRIEPWTPVTAYQGAAGLEDYAKAAAGDRMLGDQKIGGLYETMIKPLAPFCVRGFIWYQGESNLLAGDGLIYTAKMNALIQGWRTTWGNPSAPFYYVQLAPHTYSQRTVPEPFSTEALPILWEAQTNALAISNTGMAVITDTVDRPRDIHPKNKRDVGKRLALLALARTYSKEEVVDSGPVMRGFLVEGGCVRLTFDHAQGLQSCDGAPLSEFTIAGEDRVFYPAVATMDHGDVMVSSEKVPKPAAVRLGWHERANPNLINAARLPARSFRTDQWPVESRRPSTGKD